MSDIPIRGWIDIVGRDYQVEYLDLPHLRKKHESLPPALRRPSVRKITDAAGNQYKLLFVPPGNTRVREIHRVIGPVRHEAFMPDVLWYDGHSMLFEFIKGEHPDISSADFARDLAAGLAAVHQCQFRDINRIKYRFEFRYNLRTLVRFELVTPRLAKKAIRLYQQIEPARIIRSLDYFDVTSKNFVYDGNGLLRFIDAGAFRNNRPTGQFLVGGLDFDLLDMETFSHVYRQYHYAAFMLEHMRFLKFFHYVMKAGQRARAYSEIFDKTTVDAQWQWRRCRRIVSDLINLLED